MLPYPSINFFPKLFANDVNAIALAAKIDSYILVMKNDVIRIPRLYRADQANSLYLNELGYWLNANIKEFDSEEIKRKKIYNAIATHKVRGTWIYDCKIRIDNITGYNSSLFNLIGTSDWILCGDGISEIEYYATGGVDGIDDELGLDLIGDDTEVVIPGNVYIDCHLGIFTPVLTATQISEIVIEIQDDVVPAYYRVQLGYINTSGVFTVYSGGTIH
jgi:hypothetical protein